jgi:hypothetical protein
MGRLFRVMNYQQQQQQQELVIVDGPGTMYTSTSRFLTKTGESSTRAYKKTLAGSWIRILQVLAHIHLTHHQQEI